MPQPAASRGDAKLHRRAIEQQLAGRRLLDAGQDLHERGLAGAVLADQRVDVARLSRKSTPIERGRAGKHLGYAARLEHAAADVAVIVIGGLDELQLHRHDLDGAVFADRRLRLRR